MQALNNVGLNAEEKFEALVTFIIEGKLDDKLIMDFELSLPTSKEIPKIKNLTEFLNHRHHILRARAMLSNDDKKENGTGSSNSNNKSKCVMGCSSLHFLNQCLRFRKLDLKSKWKLIRKNRLCKQCLNSGHTSCKCGYLLCRICQMDHHTALHKNKNEQLNCKKEKS